MTPPLLITADPALRDDVARLAAAAGVTPDVVEDPMAALRSWSAAPLVLVGADLAGVIAGMRPPRRDAVHLLVLGHVPDELFRVAVVLGATDVAELPRSETWLVEVLGDAADDRRGPARMIAVAAGSGGAGATTLACALGQMAARSGEALLIDTDPLGPGLDRILGIDGRDGTRWDALCHTTGRLSARALREAVPRRDALGVLTWRAGTGERLQPFAVREALSAARRGHDTVICDLPRPSEPAFEEIAARCDVVLLVVVPTLSGVASAGRWCARFSETLSPHLVVRGQGTAERAVEAACRAPVLLTMPDQRHLEESVTLGLGPVRSHRGPLGRAAREILTGLAQVGVAA